MQVRTKNTTIKQKNQNKDQKHKRNNNQPLLIILSTSVDGGHGSGGGDIGKSLGRCCRGIGLTIMSMNINVYLLPLANLAAQTEFSQWEKVCSA